MTGADPRAERLRAIPSVREVLEQPAARRLAAAWGEAVARERVRTAVDALRALVQDGGAPAERADHLAWILARVESEAIDRGAAALQPVLNATGVVLHTNLGRAPLGSAVIDAVRAACEGYAAVEVDLATGRRGHRDARIRPLATALFGCEDALVVNNGAAGLLLALTALAPGRGVVVSRGELVEIGGGFRIPEIITACGARLVEVGATNRTRAADYEAAVGPDTAAILKVHRSNFSMSGFVEETSVTALATLARSRGIPLVHDVGSGAVDLPDALRSWDEPLARTALAQGADLVIVSGDKLLGGPQAGLVLGQRTWVERLRRHPLMRALRPGRLVLAALEATLRLHANGLAHEALPVAAMLCEPASSVLERANECRTRIGAVAHVDVTLVETVATVGGGSVPGSRIPSWAVCLGCGDETVARALEHALRTGATPVLARIDGLAVLLDLRTVPGRHVALLATAVRTALERVVATVLEPAPTPER